MFRRAQPDAVPADAHARPAGTLLLDVREDDEWEAGHAPGATHIALGKLRADALPADAHVYCVCRSGGRSSRAAEALRAAGIDATNVAGGMRAWVAAGLPVVRDDGGAGVVI